MGRLDFPWSRVGTFAKTNAKRVPQIPKRMVTALQPKISNYSQTEHLNEVDSLTMYLGRFSMPRDPNSSMDFLTSRIPQAFKQPDVDHFLNARHLHEVDSLTMYLGAELGPEFAALTRASELTSPAAVRRLQARKALLQLQDNIPEGFIPPKQLLLYLVRMGSFTSAPKVLNDDCQDDDVAMPTNMSRDELLSYCASHLDGPNLLHRTFANNNYCNESFIPNGRTTIRVLQWNLLSQCLGTNNDNFVCCPEDALAWERRKHLLVQEIIKYSPDVICLQEVDHFKYLKKTLATQGYEGMFFPKPDSPCVYIKDNNGPDGCAIFYLSSRFELLNKETRILEVWNVQSNQVAVVAILRDRVTGEEVAVATTHLKARSGALLAALRNEQGKDLTEFVREVAGNRPVLLSGDFNATPNEPVYSTVLSRPDLPLASAYSAFTGREPNYTTWKIRSDGEHCTTIDYIFFSKDRFTVQNILNFPSGEELGPDRAPCYSYPSDHFSLCCDLTLNPF